MRTVTLVVIGVSGCGKSTVARAVADRLGWVFAEGDDFHPAGNIAKMRTGHPLTDDDRWPWLAALADWIGAQEAAGENGVVTCSALRRAYRDRLDGGHPSVDFAHLTVAPATLRRRLEERRGHFMPASLLGSQLALLEPLQADEPGVTLAADQDTEAVVDAVLAHLQTLGR